MITLFRSSKLLMLLLALTAISFSSCEDDNDDILGVDVSDEGTLVLSSNTSGLVGVLDLEDSPLDINTFAAAGMDSDGIYYDDNGDRIYQVNRSDNNLIAYDDVLDRLDDEGSVPVLYSSTSDFSNGRGMTVVGNQYIVAQDASEANGNANRFVIYEDANGDGFNRLRTFNTNINLWGLQYVGDKLYAIVDNSDSLAVFNNFFDNTDNSMVMPDSYIRIDGLVRTHGIRYNTEDDVMILTDVGSADSETDGALFIINNFSTFSGDVATAADYTKISGDNTMLGNPVDVDYDQETNMIYVAERKRGGGLLLSFPVNASGETMPMTNLPFAGISSLWLNRD